MAKKRFSLLKSIHRQQVPNPGTAHPFSAYRHCKGIFNGKPGVVANLLEKCEIARTITAKTEIVSHHQMPDSQPLNKDIVNKTHGRIAAKRLIEAQAQHNIDAFRQQGLELLTKSHQPGWRFFALKNSRG